MKSGKVHHKETAGERSLVAYSQTTVTVGSDRPHLLDSFGELLKNTDLSGPTLDSDNFAEVKASGICISKAPQSGTNEQSGLGTTDVF